MARQNIIEKYSYLIGTKVNKWTVLELKKMNITKEQRLYAICECECGTVKPVLVKNLIKNLSKDCGCGRKNTIGEIFSKDLTGQRFGKLTVIEALEQRSKTGHKLYKCLCDCGNEVVVQTNLLTTHHTNSCGCLVSYWNMYIRQFLKENKIAFKPEYIIYVNSNYYRFDFHLPEYNLLIEYDGQQHYEPVKFFGTEEDAENVFRRTQESDKVKNQYCEEHNINLLRIPYWETKNIETIINNYLQRLNEEGFVDDSTRYVTV